MENERADALSAIDSAAAAQITAVRTNNWELGYGDIYAMKVAEARAWQLSRRTNELEPDAGLFPLLSAELGITGANMVEITGTIMAKHKSLITHIAQIEATRLAAKKAVRAAATMADINSVLNALTWPAIEHVV